VLPERGDLERLLEEAGVEVVVTPLAVLRRGLLNPRGALSLARALRRDRGVLGRLAASSRAALVHSNTSVVLGGHALDLPHLVHAREIYAGVAGFAGELAWPRLRRRLEEADALACVSQAVADQFSSIAFVLHDGLTRVPRPRAREDARAELGLPADRFVVALLGRVSDWKGQDVLAQALARPPLAQIGALGLVAGDAFAGQERLVGELATLRAELGLADRLRLLGFRGDVDTVLGAADAVAVPSTRPDPLPNTALEAGAAGLPVVGSAAGGLPEIVENGETGLLVQMGSVEQLASALRRLADDPAAARRMGERAASLVPERFSLTALLDGVQDCYERLSR
jgi:glycosyltransferase involved in cell wall biosynthesis